jgi:hypothetical protein
MLNVANLIFLGAPPGLLLGNSKIVTSVTAVSFFRGRFCHGQRESKAVTLEVLPTPDLRCGYGRQIKQGHCRFDTLQSTLFSSTLHFFLPLMSF